MAVVKLSRGAETVRLPVEGELTFASLSDLVAQSWPEANVSDAVYKDQAGAVLSITPEDFHVFLESAEVSPAGRRLWRIELRAPEAASLNQETQIDECLAPAPAEGTPDECIEPATTESCAAAPMPEDAESEINPELRAGYAKAELKEACPDKTNLAGANEAQSPGAATGPANPLDGLRSVVRRIATAELPTWQETKEELGTRLTLDSWRRRPAPATRASSSQEVVAQEVVPQVVADILTTFDANQDGFLNFEECQELQKSIFGRDLRPDTYHAFCCRFGLQPTRGLSGAALTNILCGTDASLDSVEANNMLRDIEAAKEEAVHDLIMMFDSNEDGYLNFEDCKELQAALFEGKLWEATYKDLCNRLSADPEIGFGPEALASILVSSDSRLQSGGASATIFNRDFVRANRQANATTAESTFQGLAEHVLRVPGVIGAAARTMKFSRA